MSVRCRSCDAPIRWASTARGKAIPLDAEPSDDGNVVVIDGEAHVLGPLEVEAHEGPLYVSHFAICPNAAQHRKRA